MPEPEAQSPRRQKALEIFLGLEDKRSYRMVADQMGVSLPTIKRWAKEDDWQTKARKHDAAFVRQLADRFAEGRISRTERNLKIIQAALISLAKEIAAGRIKGQLADLPRLVQLERELTGDKKTDEVETATHRTPVIIYLPKKNGSEDREDGPYTS